MNRDDLHDCPKVGCGQRIPFEQMACRGHWFALPPDLRRRRDGAVSGLRPWQLSIWQSVRGAPMASLGIHVDLHTPTLDLHLPGWTIQLGRNGYWGVGDHGTIDGSRAFLGGRVLYSPAPRWAGHTDNCDHDRPDLLQHGAAALPATDPAGLDALDEFTAANAAKMRERLAHGARKFGSISWREEPYDDHRNRERLQRAVDHLLVAVRTTPDNTDEWAKRAADVSNQAFMYADPLRYRGNSRPDARLRQETPDREGEAG